MCELERKLADLLAAIAVANMSNLVKTDDVHIQYYYQGASEVLLMLAKSIEANGLDMLFDKYDIE